MKIDILPSEQRNALIDRFKRKIDLSATHIGRKFLNFQNRALHILIVGLHRVDIQGPEVGAKADHVVQRTVWKRFQKEYLQLCDFKILIQFFKQKLKLYIYLSGSVSVDAILWLLEPKKKQIAG